MQLKSFSYQEFSKNPKYWELQEFDVNDINLMVGNNSSGKTRTLNVISSLSNLITSPRIPFSNGIYHAHFIGSHQDDVEFFVEINENTITSEKLSINGCVMIERSQDGSGTIKSVAGDSTIRFKIPPNELISIRRDEIQFPYLEQLYNWAARLRLFRFAKQQEKNTLAIIDSNKAKAEEFNLHETDKVIGIFRRGKKKFDERYTSLVVSDLNSIGYNVESVDLGPIESIQIETPIQAKVVGLRIKENDREGYTDQNSMSDGLFRALSILIHFDYYALEKMSGCVLIDDIGEGLDYERSTKLIQILISKAKEINIQLIMSTNDKFVMNNTSLEYWQVVSREGGLVRLFNNKNSEKTFKQFRFTGLNNFDFFTTAFFKNGMS